MGRVLSLYLPSLAIDRLQRKWHRNRNSHGDARSQPPPLLLVTRDRNRQVVVQACERSKRCGVKVGMSLSHARALLPHEVAVRSHEPARDAAALNALARWALRFTPAVQADPPDGLLLDMAGCEHLYGGTRAMLGQVIEKTNRLGVHVRGAIGPTVGCAWALARFGQGNAIVESMEEVLEALNPIAVRGLRIESEIEHALHAVAVETVEQLMRLPRRSLADRFGDALLLRVDQALGQAFEPIEPIRPIEPVRVERAFDGPVKQLEAIMQSVRELVDALCAQLAKREAGVRQLRLELERIDTQDLQEKLTLSRPSRDARHLWTLLRPRLEHVHLGFGIEHVTLHAVAIDRLIHQQVVPDGWHEARTSHAPDSEIGALTDQLIARFGADRVSRIEVRQTHVPERTFIHQSADDLRVEREPHRMVIDADRPTLLHAHPQPVRVMLLAPEGPVMSISRGDQHLRIITTIGPERITPRWWLVGHDHRKLAPRDYYKVQDEHGRWWWLYRQAGISRWFVHGRWC